MGFDGAIQKLTEHMEGPLVEEFHLALGEMRVGETRADALRHLVDRVDVNEMASFIRAIIQADQLGISLGRILRVQAADARPPPGRGGGEGDEGPDQDAVPDRAVHLPGHVRGRPRAQPS